MVTKICAPVGVQIELTEKCNHHCFYCYNFWEQRANDLSLDKIDLILLQIQLNKIPVITVTGGEPFMNKKGLFYMIELAQRYGISVSINTNLSLPNRNDLAKIRSTIKNVSFLVSLPSADKKRYAEITNTSIRQYNKVINNIRILRKLGLKVSINMVLTKTNLDLLEETAELSKTLGISTFCATKALPNISTSNNREFLLNTNEAIDSINRIDSVSHKLDLPVDVLGCYPKCLLAKTNAFERFANRACVAGCTTLTIGPDGKVRPCSHIDRSYGNIFEEPLKNIWDRMDDWKTNKFVPEECSNCSLFNMCRGGCRVNNPQNDLHCLDYYADVEYLKAKNFEIKLLNKNRARVSAPLGPFIVNPDVNFREESFGFLIFGGSQKMIIQFVNQKAGSYLKCQKENGREFTVIDFVESSGAKTEEDKEKVKELFSKFIAKRILILKQKGGIKNEK